MEKIMPYIKQDYRNTLNVDLVGLRNTINALPSKDVCGILNYVITNLLNTIPEQLNNSNWNYATINSAVGVLECAKQEFYRRLAAPYQNECIKLNGDVDIYR